MAFKGRKKRLGFRRFIDSFGYSIEGLKYAYLNEQSMIIHGVITILVIIFGIIFKISTMEWLFCVSMFGFVMGAELLNTAIEAVVDMVMPDIHPLAKIAKDTASAAVFILSVVAFIVGAIIFFPRFYAFFISLIGG